MPLRSSRIRGFVTLVILLLIPLSGPVWSVDLPGFVRGEANGDQGVDISDAITILQYLFGVSNELPCLDAGDANDDGAIDLGDAIGTLNLVFGGGPAQLPPPFGQCGTDR